MRDIVLEETVYLDFTTRAFATGVPGTLGGTPVLSVMEENNATPITAGVSLSVDRASVAGFNMATIVATAANGYEAGKGYSVYISTGTVGGVSVVGEIVKEFTIQASAAAQDLANGTDGLTALKTGIDAIPTTAMRGTDNSALASVCTEVRLQALTDWLDGGRLDLLLDAIPTTAMRGTDGANTVVPDAAGVAPTAVQIRQEMDSNSVDLNTLVVGQTTINNNVLSNSTDIAAIPTTPMRGTDSAALASVCTETRLQALTDWLNGGRLDLLLDAIPTTAMRGTDGANTVVPDAAGTAPTLIEIFTTAMTESYAADGVAPTLAQCLFIIQQFLHEHASAGTTKTVKKIDGSTTAATFTYDDATNPTSLTRAT